jgi:hypothetical protein
MKVVVVVVVVVTMTTTRKCLLTHPFADSMEQVLHQTAILPLNVQYRLRESQVQTSPHFTPSVIAFARFSDQQFVCVSDLSGACYIFNPSHPPVLGVGSATCFLFGPSMPYKSTLMNNAKFLVITVCTAGIADHAWNCGHVVLLKYWS